MDFQRKRFKKELVTDFFKDHPDSDSDTTRQIVGFIADITARAIEKYHEEFQKTQENPPRPPAEEL